MAVAGATVGSVFNSVVGTIGTSWTFEKVHLLPAGKTAKRLHPTCTQIPKVPTCK